MIIKVERGYTDATIDFCDHKLANIYFWHIIFTRSLCTVTTLCVSFSIYTEAHKYCKLNGSEHYLQFCLRQTSVMSVRAHWAGRYVLMFILLAYCPCITAFITSYMAQRRHWKSNLNILLVCRFNNSAI